ncbi:MAG TPA: tetraacyldisaccharide 4'-kinase [Geminicoccaceae bacterium]|nr:tetraacyldisaccharide 4'-kinase [Geminicoccaceae bacterium]
MRRPGFWDRPGLLPSLLTPLAALVAAGSARREARARPEVVPVPVICVGEATVGGSGKTPVAIALGHLLRATGATPHLLLRGHGGRLRGPVRVDPRRHDAAAVGDEALLHARHGPTWVGRKRAAAARAAVAAGATHLVLDDGLQHPGLAKTLSLLVIDTDSGIGNGRVLPAGPLREPFPRSLARADALVLVGGARAEAAPWRAARLPVLAARLVPAAAAAGPAGRRVLAFAGIGRPEKFFATCTALGCRVERRFAFSDHHRYRPSELAHLRALALEDGLEIITTEKDFVRLPHPWREFAFPLPVELIWDDPDGPYNLMWRLGAMEHFELARCSRGCVAAAENASRIIGP